MTECCQKKGWDIEPVSILHPSVSDGDYRLCFLIVKRSNLASYRFSFVAEGSAVVARLLEGAKHAG
ncbi:MAG: hypothetical protein H6527_00955 [Actinobacteria bacterium]|nr:hypothetical protein [Actinomycetota bacterium]